MRTNKFVKEAATRNLSLRMLQSTKTISSRLQLILDIAIVDGLLFLFVWLKGDTNITLYYYPAVIVPVLMWFIYSNSEVYQRSGGKIEQALNLLWAWAKVVGVIIAWAFIIKGSAAYSRQVVILWFIFAAIAQAAAHIGAGQFMRAYFSKHRDTIPSIVVGNSELGAYLAEQINSNQWTPDQVLGVVCDLAEGEELLVKDLPYLGPLAELRQLAEQQGVRRVYFALDMTETPQLRQLQLGLIDLNVDIIWAPDIFSLHLLSPSLKEIAGVPLYSLSESPIRGGALISKLMLDKTLSIVALILLAPVMIIAAIAVKLTSKGPVFFRQERHGLDGKIIQVLKFRSMKLHEEKEGEVTQAKKHDPRLTKVGAFLRKTSIDELPQLFNVLQGDMSLVGPRPHAKAHNAFYSDKISAYMSRHRIPPGITGLAQINGCRGETETLEKMERRVVYDLEYINNWSIWLDITILFKTVFTLFSKNAY